MPLRRGEIRDSWADSRFPAVRLFDLSAQGRHHVHRDKDQFKLVSGEKALGLYQWNTKTARHYFCRTCGVYTHHWRRSRPEFGYNIGCIEGVDVRALPDIEIFNGQAMTLVGEDE